MGICIYNIKISLIISSQTLSGKSPIAIINIAKKNKISRRERKEEKSMKGRKKKEANDCIKKKKRNAKSRKP